MRRLLQTKNIMVSSYARTKEASQAKSMKACREFVKGSLSTLLSGALLASR
nr:Tubulin gamma-1 chain [Ipomoea batatas]GMC56527.1 Tubulin gamma-1 chain [Ipomoea batatas]GMC83963.1 Tubulin gamma-1 chain [Ipomoea batatas]